MQGGITSIISSHTAPNKLGSYIGKGQKISGMDVFKKKQTGDRLIFGNDEIFFPGNEREDEAVESPEINTDTALANANFNSKKEESNTMKPIKPKSEKKLSSMSLRGLNRKTTTDQDKAREKKIGDTTKFLFSHKFEKDAVDNYSRTKESEFLYYQYFYNTSLQCIFSLASIFSAIVSYEIEYTLKNEKVMVVHTANWFCFISSIFLWVAIFFDYFIQCRIFHLNKFLPESIWRKETWNVIQLTSTLLFFLLHPNPVFYGMNISMFNEKFNVTSIHSLNSIFTVICLLRMYYFVKFYLVISDYYSPRTQRICHMNNFNTSLTFSMKANMLKTPYHVYILLFILILVYCSFCLRIFERVLDDVSEKDFDSYWNAIWCLIITMTTVGYGDYYPSSTLGRTIGIISCICGVFLISMLIVTITNLLNFQGTEKNVFLILQRIKLMKEKDDLAKKLISNYITLMKIDKKGEFKDKNKRQKLKEEILLSMHYFKEKVTEFNSTFPAYSDFDIILENLETLDLSMESLKNKYKLLECYVEQISKKITD